jgi:hypothetical protein
MPPGGGRFLKSASYYSPAVQRAFQRLVVGVAFACIAGPLSAQRGAVTAHRSLDQLVGEAEVIVHGSVVSAKVEPHPQFKNLMTVLVTMNVVDTLKGKTTKTLQFRQYVWDIRDQLDAAQYGKGQELLLLLGPVSQYGLTSPVGLEQGRFRIQRNASGQAVAVNGKGNVGLFRSSAEPAESQGRRLSEQTRSLIQNRTAGPIPLTDLKAAIRNLGGTK